MSNLKKDVDLIRKLVNKNGVKNIPHAEITTLCQQCCDYEVEDNRVTLEQRKEIANTIIKKYQPTDLATTNSGNHQLEVQDYEESLSLPNNLADNPIQPVSDSPQAESDSIIVVNKNYTPVEESSNLVVDNNTPIEESSHLVINNYQKHSEITHQAAEMGITLTEQQISVVASDLDNQFSDESEFIASVKSALIAFIDYESEQSNNKFNQMLGEVSDYAESKQSQRFDNMTNNLRQFSSKLQDKNSFFRARQSAIVAAIHAKIPK